MYRTATPRRGELAHPVEQPLDAPGAQGRRWARRAARTGRRGPAPARSRRPGAARRTAPGTASPARCRSPHSRMMSRVRRASRASSPRRRRHRGWRRGRRSPRPTGAARSSSAGTPWRSTRASGRCRRPAARARRRTAPCPRPARTGRTGWRRGSTCPPRCGRPGPGTARRRWKGQPRAARGWCRTASRHRSPRRAPGRSRSWRPVAAAGSHGDGCSGNGAAGARAGAGHRAG